MSTTFTKRFVKELKKNEYSQADFSRLSGIPARTISDYARGLYTPTWEHVQLISLAFGLSCDAFRDSGITLPSKGKR